MENLILIKMDYNLQVTTPFDYLNLFMSDFDRFGQTVVKFEYPEGELYFKTRCDKA